MILIITLLYTLNGKITNQHKYRMSHNYSTTKNYIIVICTVHNNTFGYQCQDTDTFQNK